MGRIFYGVNEKGEACELGIHGADEQSVECGWCDCEHFIYVGTYFMLFCAKQDKYVPCRCGKRKFP